MSNTDTPAIEGWTIVELMGHRRLAGYLREQQVAGAGMLRLDVPGADGEPLATQFYAPSAVYCLTPTTEEIARAVARQGFEAPVHRWELPQPTTRQWPVCDNCGERHDPDDVCAGTYEERELRV